MGLAAELYFAQQHSKLSADFDPSSSGTAAAELCKETLVTWEAFFQAASMVAN